MPTNVHTAAVEHRMIRGNGPMLVMRSLAQQLENATGDSYPPTRGGSAATINTATTSYLKLAAPHCSSQVRSLLRLRGAAERPGRHPRLRAHFTTRSRMPILRPVNSLGTQLSQNIMNYGIDLIVTRRAIPRWERSTPLRKIGIPRQEHTRRRSPLGSITRFRPQRAARPGRRPRMPSTFVGLPQLLFCSKKNWSLNYRHDGNRSDLTNAGPSRGTVTRGRHGTAIASSCTRLRMASGGRVCSPDYRFSATFNRLIQSELRQLITRLTRALSYNSILSVASVASSADFHACWITGERASYTPGAPVATLSADTPGRLQRFSTGIVTGFCLTSYLGYHVCWVIDESARDAPGSPAATRTSDTAGRLQRFSACYTIGARRISDLERQTCSNFTATCPIFYLERSACWSTGESASDSPGTPVASPLCDTLGRPQHLLDCCFFSACRLFYWDRNACWTTGWRASDIPGQPVASPSLGTLGRPQRFLRHLLLVHLDDHSVF